MQIDARELKRAYLVAGLSEDDVRRLAALAECRVLAPGETLVREGGDDSDLFVILRGSASVFASDGTSIVTRGAGAVIGEMALIEDLPRSATVTATEELTVAQFASPDIRAFLYQNKPTGFVVLGNLARGLSERLDEAADSQPDSDALMPAGARADRRAQIVEGLTQHYRIAGLFDHEVEQIAELAQLREFEDGEVIADAGEPDCDLFVVLEGSAVLSTRTHPAFRTRGKGAVIGELALIESLPRSSTVTAKGEVLVARFDGKKLRGFINRNPDVGYVLVSNLARLLSARLRDASSRSEAAKGAAP